jgi:TonB family C-terminal domain
MNRSHWIGLGMTVVFHALLLVLCFRSGLKYIYPPPEEKSVVMEFIDEEEPPQMEVGREPRAENPDPDKDVQLVKRSEAPVEGHKANEAEEATPGDDGDVEVPAPKKEIDKRALFPSAANNKKDTLATQTSSTPSQRFDPGHASGNTNEGSSDGEPSARLAGRNVVGSLPLPAYGVQKSGRVVVRITVDREGNVTDAIPGIEGTTVQDRSLWTAAKQAALQAKFNANPKAPLTQEGTITYIFKLQ